MQSSWLTGSSTVSGHTDFRDRMIRCRDSEDRCKNASRVGLCSEERSMISPDYARNWICDFVLGKDQHFEPLLFDQGISGDLAYD